MARTTARMARTRRRKRQTDRVTLIVLIAFLVLACVTAVLGFILARNAVASWRAGEPVLSGFKAKEGAPSSSVPTPAGPLQRVAGPDPVPWDGQSRVTILVMGMDYRDWEDGTDVPRTDSMILVSFDPKSMTAGMLSIPRDTWVNIPGMGENKINTAYRWGEVYQLPGGGPALAMKTVEDFIDLPIDYYALIDFNAFVRFIDEMGGLDMHIREKITVDPIGPGNTRTLEPGVQTLDGATVLAYARQRDLGEGDFARSKRQQEVILAIRDQILQFNMLPTLIAKAPTLYREISAGISTNLTFGQIIQLAGKAAQVPEENIRKGVISPPDQVEITTNPADGQSILLPNEGEIRILRDRVFDTSGAVAPRPVKEEQKTEGPTNTAVTVEQVKKEKARVMIMNGTSIQGLASKTGEMLKSQGVNVIAEKNAETKSDVTTINDYSGKKYEGTVTFIIEKLGLTNVHRYYIPDTNAEADIVIILGADYKGPE